MRDLAMGHAASATAPFAAAGGRVASATSGRTRSAGDRYLILHGLLLLGYALAGKGFAYLGVHPVFIGEVALALGLCTALATRAALRIPRSGTTLWLVLLMGWGAVRTLPYLSDYGTAALRDAALWGYASFAFVLAALLLSRPARLVALAARYGRFARIAIVAIPLLWLLQWWTDWLPTVDAAGVRIVHLKPGSVLVHLAGVASFLLIGLARVPLLALAVLWLNVGLMAVHGRGGTLAFLMALGCVAASQLRLRKLWVATGASAMVAAFALAVLPEFTINDRSFSAAQLRTNLLSVVSDEGARDLQGTKEWRLSWWSRIVDYTVLGPYRWTGKGFGVNLASSDGFHVNEDRRLRSPHNSHLTFLARAGLPGLALWIAFQASWARDLWRARRRARAAGHLRTADLFLFLIAYWLALAVNASFDVSLEGPMDGIWFWSVIGVGMAAVRIQGRFPGLLEPSLRSVCGRGAPRAAARRSA